MKTLMKSSRHPPQWVRNLANLYGCTVVCTTATSARGHVSRYYKFLKCVGVETYLVNPRSTGYDRRRQRPKYRQYSISSARPQESVIECISIWVKGIV